MKTKLVLALALGLVAGAASPAAVITLSSVNTGYYWYEKSSWMGGSDTTTGFSYGDASGLIHVQTNYQYYGGADRYWQWKDAYFQIDLSSLVGEEITLATLNFYVTAINTPAETFLKHVDTQSTLATGDAGQKLVGTTNVASSTTFVPGWNSIDVTSFIQSDLDKEYSFVALSLLKFAQVQDQNRLLSFYGASTSVEIDGLAAKPYLDVVVATVPEPAGAALFVGIGALFVCGRRRWNR